MFDFFKSVALNMALGTAAIVALVVISLFVRMVLPKDKFFKNLSFLTTQAVIILFAGMVYYYLQHSVPGLAHSDSSAFAWSMITYLGLSAATALFIYR